MEKILFRKLLIDGLIFFSITLLSAGIIIWVFQAVNFLDIIIEDGRDYLIYLKITLLNFPKIISKLIPFSFFFSFCYVINKYEINNELMIYWNFGINKIQIINFLFLASLLVMLFQLLLTTYFVPKFQNKARTYIKESDVNFFKNFTKPKKFNDTLKGLTIYSEGIDNDGNLFNIYLKKNVDANEFQITYAKSGSFLNNNNTEFLILSDGETISGFNDSITTFAFSKSSFNLSSLKSHSTTYTKIQEISTVNLFLCIKSFLFSKDNNYFNVENCDNKNKSSVFEETYKRIIVPLYIPLLMLIVMFLIIVPKENINFYKLRTATYIVGFLLIIFSETTIRFISEKLILNIFFSTLPFMIILFLYKFFLINLKLKKIK